ncbi:MAG: DNA primase [Chloroflexota bacterium]
MTVSNSNQQSSTIVEFIKSQIDITDLISKYVDLNGTSKVKKGLCPFYPEKTPSFIVYPETQTFKCFCGSCAGFSGGDIYTFMMRVENVDFKEALQKCAEVAGVSLQKNNNKQPIAKSDLFSALEAAADFFYSCLKSPAGNSATEYLRARGFNDDQIKRFGFGLSPLGMITLVDHLKKVGIKSLPAVKSGLVQKWADGSWHDFFQERLTIEIRDENNNLVGFGARTLSNKTPKYINTQQTEIFNKSGLLFGLNVSKEAISQSGECIIVEGYMDVFSAHSEGFTNVVACMGTAVSLSQLDKAFEYTNRVILCLDSDIAGKRATVNNLIKIINSDQEIKRLNRSVWIANISSGKDPDEIIKNNPDDWKELLKNAIPIHQHLIENIDLAFNLSDETQKREAANTIYKLIFQNTDSHMQDEILGRLAKKLKTSRENLPDPQVSRNKIARYQSIPTERTSENPIESHVISLLLQNEQLIEYVKNQTEDLFSDPQLKAIFDQIRTNHKNNTLNYIFDDVLSERVNELLSAKLPTNNEKDLIDELNDCINRLYKFYLRRQKKEQQQVLEEFGEDTTDASISTVKEVISDGLKTNELLKKIQSNQN